MNKKVLIFIFTICMILTSSAYAQKYNILFYENPEFWANGEWQLLTVEQDEGENGIKDQVTNFTYDSDKKLTKIQTSTTEGDASTVYFYYNAAGYVEKQEQDYLSDGTIDMVLMFTVDSEGKVLKMETDMENNGSIDSTTTFTYDSEGHKIKEEYEFSAGSITLRNVTTYAYDTGGNMIRKELDNMGDGIIEEVTTYTYDVNNNLTKKEFDIGNTGTPKEITVYTYDGNGKLVKEEFDKNNDESIDQVATLTYDSNGNLSSVEYKSDSDPLTKETFTWDNSRSESSRGECTYEVVSPNGEEVWCADSFETITWEASGGDCGSTVKLEYSSDSGNSWQTIITGTSNDGTYAWLTPESLSSSRVFVRVTDEGNTQYWDKSDEMFTVVDCSGCAIVITEPNGDETWLAKNTYEIKWVRRGNDCGDSVKIMYSRDSGNSWENITISTANNGSYFWTIPYGIDTDRARIRVEDTSDSDDADMSNNDFSIDYDSDSSNDNCFINSVLH